MEEAKIWTPGFPGLFTGFLFASFPVCKMGAGMRWWRSSLRLRHKLAGGLAERQRIRVLLRWVESSGRPQRCRTDWGKAGRK